MLFRSINLALGILYAWSLIKGRIGESFGWDKARLNDPYAVCCLVFAFAMIFAGRCQDKFGPRLTASIGGLLVGLGFFIASRSASSTPGASSRAGSASRSAGTRRGSTIRTRSAVSCLPSP